MPLTAQQTQEYIRLLEELVEAVAALTVVDEVASELDAVRTFRSQYTGGQRVT